MNQSVYALAHSSAFNVAATMPGRYLQEASCLIDQLLETGASFDEAKTALQQLSERFQETPRGQA